MAVRPGGGWYSSEPAPPNARDVMRPVVLSQAMKDDLQRYEEHILGVARAERKPAYSLPPYRYNQVPGAVPLVPVQPSPELVERIDRALGRRERVARKIVKARKGIAEDSWEYLVAWDTDELTWQPEASITDNKLIRQYWSTDRR